ncbi:MAG TPA: MEDS domain-containing protein, partial [Myxococcales bacterium]|nr:MEDS domain-containing protein [Myxococcales bacterium]
MDTQSAELQVVPSDQPRHLVQFYETDGFLTRVTADFLEAGLRDGDGALVIATEPHRDAVLEELASRKLDVQRARLAGTLTLLDAAQVLREVTAEGMPHQARFEEVVGSALRRASAGGTRRVRAFGEMVELLWNEGRRAAALRLEELWNDLARVHDFSLLCAYTLANFYKEDGLPAVCAQHGHILAPERGPLGSEPGIQETVRELAAEIAQRRHAEEALRSSVVDLRRAEAAARRSEEELKDFAERAIIGLQWVDHGGRVIWANQAQLDMLGYQRDEYVGQRMSRFHIDEPSGGGLFERLAWEEALRDCEARLRARDGSVRDVVISANAYRREGRVVYYRCFTRDVTDRKRADGERARLLAELQQTVHLNEMFTAILGHDLRNPLNAVMTSIELGLRRAREEPLQRTLRRALGSTKRMAAMISQLLDFTRARQGGLPLERKALDLQAVVEEVRAEVELTSPGRAIQIDRDGDLHGRWDRTHLSQALSNLIGNAAQHG